MHDSRQGDALNFLLQESGEITPRGYTMVKAYLNFSYKISLLIL